MVSTACFFTWRAFLCSTSLALELISVYGVLYLQLGYDSQERGVGDGQVFLAALKRCLIQATMQVGYATMAVEAVLTPIREALRHWKDLEPYDFRVPVPCEITEAVLGIAVINGDWDLVLFVIFSFHCWLRPAEGLASLWDDISIIRGEVITHGVVRIGNPKVRKPPVQHVLIECRAVARVYEVLAGRFYVKGRRLCNFSPTVLAAIWRAILVTLGLERPIVIGNLPASNENSSCKNRTVGGFQPGAATSDYLVTQNCSRDGCAQARCGIIYN